MLHTVLPNFYTLNVGNAYPVLTGTTLTGIVTNGGTSLTVKYDCFDEAPAILVYLNDALIMTQPGTTGTNITQGIFVEWLATDSIEVVLVNLEIDIEL